MHMQSEDSGPFVPPMRWSRGQLEAVPLCPACGSSHRDNMVRTIRDHVGGLTPDLWSIRQCADCRSLYLDPRPDQASLPEAYSVYYTHRQDIEPVPVGVFSRALWAMVNGYLNHRFGLARQPAARIGRLVFALALPWRYKLDYYGRHLFQHKYPHKGMLLDVGCGNGTFLARARDMGWTVTGVDFDPVAVRTCRAQGFNVFEGSINAVPLSMTGHFNVVTVSHTLEHVCDPRELLDASARILCEGGILWLALPNPQAIGAKLFGRSWRGLETPRHLCIPSQRQLTKLLSEFGFMDICIKRRGVHAKRISAESAEIARREGGGSMRLRAMLAPVLRMMADIAATFSGRWGEETVITAVRRPDR